MNLNDKPGMRKYHSELIDLFKQNINLFENESEMWDHLHNLLIADQIIGERRKFDQKYFTYEVKDENETSSR